MNRCVWESVGVSGSQSVGDGGSERNVGFATCMFMTTAVAMGKEKLA